MVEPVYIYEKLPTDLEENGKALIDWKDAPEITRIINQMYSFYGNYAMNGQNRKMIKKGNWIKAQWTDGTWQYFKIIIVYKTLQSVSFNATHLGYEANRNFIQLAYTAKGNGKQIMANLKNNLAFKQPFEYLSNVKTMHQFTAKEVNPISAIIGQNEGNQNLAGVTNGELDMDNYKLILKNRIGEDRGFRIDLGVNLESIKETVDDTGIKNSLYLVGGVPDDKVYDDEQPPITYKFLEIKGVTDENRQIGKRENSECKNLGDLKKWGQTLFDNDRIHEPKVTHEINMIDLENTVEYKKLYEKIARVNFGDTVHCDIDYMGVTNISERMVECVYLPTLGKYKSIVLGNDLGMYTDQVQTQVSEAKKELKQTASELSNSVIQASQMITGNSGGHVIQHPKNEPSDIGIMDTDDINTAKHVLRMNKSGIGFSKTGWNGKYLTAWTIDGVFNADFIKAGTLEGILFRTTFEKSATGIEIEKGRISFIGFDSKSRIGRLTPSSAKEGEGISITLDKGKYLSFHDGEGTLIFEIPVNSTQKSPALNTFGKHTHKGELHVDRLFVGGKEVVPGQGSGGGGGTPPGLTTEQEKNAWAIWSYFKTRGWTEQSIAGMLGNMQSESGIVADIDELGGGGGYGLVQWTPKSKLVDWCNARGLNYRTIDAQCQRIQWEMENEQQWIATNSYPYSFKAFTNKKNISECAYAFITNYERPLNPNQPIRATQAQYWYDKLRGLTGDVSWKNPVRSSYVVTQEWDASDYWSGGSAGIHGGIDLASVPAGSTPDIYAAKSGTILITGVGSVEGNYIMIDHGEGFYTYYGHLSSVKVKQGDKVTNNTVIGTMGTTGGSTGVHLHFEVRKGGQSSNFRINPRDVINI
ncbi:hypothetical protein CI088_07885 [Enterococcus plantarum]|uniref:Peptidase M23 n=1 Tax=Enterococcus plantarum TaxID=1077675 RepID=A0A2W3Z2R6_9ENTE|nr:hypothetical protein CI088_07885 [Enterococcus plantarum]